MYIGKVKNAAVAGEQDAWCAAERGKDKWHPDGEGLDW